MLNERYTADYLIMPQLQFAAIKYNWKKMYMNINV